MQTLQWSLCDHSSVHTYLMGLSASAVMWLTGRLHAMVPADASAMPCDQQIQDWMIRYDAMFLWILIMLNILDSNVHGANIGANRTQVGPMLVPWILLSGMFFAIIHISKWWTKSHEVLASKAAYLYTFCGFCTQNSYEICTPYIGICTYKVVFKFSLESLALNNRVSEMILEHTHCSNF